MQSILIADDSRLLRTRVRSSLGDFPYRVFDAANGQAGLDIAKSRTIDLLVVDVNMPLMGGLEMMVRLRSCVGYQRTPVFFMTTEPRVDDALTGARLGATGWVAKPFNPGLLSRAIHKVLLTVDSSRQATGT